MRVNVKPQVRNVSVTVRRLSVSCRRWRTRREEKETLDGAWSVRRVLTPLQSVQCMTRVMITGPYTESRAARRVAARRAPMRENARLLCGGPGPLITSQGSGDRALDAAAEHHGA